MGAEIPPAALDAAAWLVTYALHSTVLLLAALVAFAWIGRAARRSARVADAAPAWRERIGRVALLGGLATAGVQTALGLEPFGVRPALVESAASPVSPSVERPAWLAAWALPEMSGEPARRAWTPAFPFQVVPVPGNLRAGDTPAPRSAAGERAMPAGLADPRSPRRAIWIAAFLALWVAVGLTACARRFLGWRALRASLAGAEPVTDPAVLATFERLCTVSGLARGGVRLLSAPRLAAPLTRGVRHAEICVPPRALVDLEADELEALLAHEIAHARRRDPAWLLVHRALEVCLCLQPLNRVVARRLEDDAELLCDDRAVVWTGERLPLASCLTEVASWLVAARTAPRFAAPMAAHGARLTRRVERLVDEGHAPDPGVRRPISTAVAAGLAASAVAIVPGFAGERATGPPTLEQRLDLTLATRPAALAGLGADTRGASAAEDASGHGTARVGRLARDPARAEVLGDVLADLGLELARLRAVLVERVGGAALEPEVLALARRVQELASREAALRARLAAASRFDLSPTTTDTQPEDR